MSEHSLLIVDDEAIVRESIRDWLQESGYNVATAENGEEALKIIEAQDFSILVVDERLPGKTGIRILKEIKALKPQIKFIVITAYPSIESAVEAMKLGAIDYLIKPIAPDQLEKLIRDTLLTCDSEELSGL